MQRPKILITREVALEMAKETLDHSNIETAWGIYGLKSKDNQTVIITGILRPSGSDIVRNYATVKLGGEKLAQAVRWLSANHKLMKKAGLTDADGFRFGFLYMAHSHHGLGVDSYSHTDRASILGAVEVDGMDIAIGPLATIESLSMTVKPFRRKAGTISVVGGSRVNLRFYVMTKSMVEQGRKQPLLITPEIVDAVSVPEMPPLGWHFTREADFDEQERLLQSYGCKVSVAYREIHDGPPYEIQFVITKSIWRGVLSVITPWDYPNNPPIFKIINPSDKQSVAQDNYPEPEHLLAGDLWQPGWDIIDGVFRLEARGEL